MPHTNTQWYPYEEFGAYFRLEDGVLRDCPMMADGSRDGDDGAGEVDWSQGIEPAHEPRLLEIAKQLERLP
jgi:hypothetical protein